jgi:flagellar basal-body rod protein FlgB
MDFNQTGIMKLARAQMAYQTQRQTVYGRNVANLDTPGFQAQEVRKVDFAKLAATESHRLEMRATSGKHLMGVNPFSGPYREEKDRSTNETTPMENNVNAEEQMAGINEAGITFNFATTMYKKMNELFKLSLGSRQ